MVPLGAGEGLPGAAGVPGPPWGSSACLSLWILKPGEIFPAGSPQDCTARFDPAATCTVFLGSSQKGFTYSIAP